ncbi:MAG: thiamine-phosphate kinase [Polyangiaceae bacterium]
MSSSELERIRALSSIFSRDRPADGRVLVGIGDDAAVLAPSVEPLVWTIDAAVEGVHFRRAWLTFEDIGYRSTMAAVSDLAAMAADPLGVLSALVLPPNVTDDDLYALARGQREAATACGAEVIGGNLARGIELSITTTALGRAPSPAPRAGARPGDALWLLGPVGLAAAGLRFLAGGITRTEPTVATEHPQFARAIEAWRRPRARIAEGLTLRNVATAAVDISDGLARDVGHLAQASTVRAVLEAAAFEAPAPRAAVSEPAAFEAPASEAAASEAAASEAAAFEPIAGDAEALELATLHASAKALGASALDLALFGGEDYAIAFTAPADARVPGAARIGRIEAIPEGERPGVMIERRDGSREPVSGGGFDHFK